MITTLGATISKTLANALFNWWTTSLPTSAAAAGTVGVGAASGCAGKLGNALAAINEIIIDKLRIGWDLDSIQQATFNLLCSGHKAELLPLLRRRALELNIFDASASVCRVWPPNRLTYGL